MQVFPEGMEATSKTLLDLLKTGLAQFQHPFMQQSAQVIPIWPSAS
jgi:hypothetical protein